MRVSQLTDADLGRWDGFVKESPAATFFHLSAWRSVIRKAFRHHDHYLFAEEAGEIVGVLPMFRVRSLLFGDALVSIPFGVYGGVAARNLEARDELIGAAKALADQLRVDHLELRCSQGPQTTWPTKDLYVTFRRPILDSDDDNLSAIPRKQRAMVRKGIKQGLQSLAERHLDNFYPMYSESVRNLGTPVFGRRYFEILMEEFGEHAEVLTILSDNRPVASVLSFYFRNEVLPFYGGGIADARRLCANDFMYWELMRESRSRGCEIFDFGRSKIDSGSYRFKTHWGFEPEPLHYQYYLVQRRELPNLSPTNPKYRLLIAAWKRLPVAVTNQLGPFLARNLG